MTALEMDFGSIAAGLFLTSVGLISIVISLFRLRSKDFSLLNFGFFCSLNGIRWLVEIPTMKSLVGFPFTYPYFHGLLTYAIVIPFSAFLVDIFGRGWHNSMLWVFRSTIVYAAAAVAYDLLRPGPLSDVSVNALVIICWCLVWILNVVFIGKQRGRELRFLRILFLVALAQTAIDNLVNVRALPGGQHFEHAGFLLLCIGLGYVAVHHFFGTESRLLAIDREIEIARRIQQSNLPASLGSPAGLDIVARYVPMMTVAGDFYDIQAKGRSAVGILIADVSGHGIGAALIGSMLKVAFSSQVEHLSDPARMLTEINRILQGKMEESFVTACYVFIDIADGTISYANAGHPPPFLYRKSRNEMKRLSTGGTILGPLENAVFERASADIAQGDRLVLYTDGFVEAQNQSGELFGDERLEAFIRAHSADSAEQTADQLTKSLLKWSGRSDEQSYDDDLTLLIVDVP